jgi:hypothetical protein
MADEYLCGKNLAITFRLGSTKKSRKTQKEKLQSTKVMPSPVENKATESFPDDEFCDNAPDNLYHDLRALRQTVSGQLSVVNLV